jgi:hypothetical protein
MTVTAKIRHNATTAPVRVRGLAATTARADGIGGDGGGPDD